MAEDWECSYCHGVGFNPSEDGTEDMECPCCDAAGWHPRDDSRPDGGIPQCHPKFLAEVSS